MNEHRNSVPLLKHKVLTNAVLAIIGYVLPVTLAHDYAPSMYRIRQAVCTILQPMLIGFTFQLSHFAAGRGQSQWNPFVKPQR